MTFKVLVVASRTLGTGALLEAMRARAAARPTQFTLLVPGARNLSEGALDAAIERFDAAGLDTALQLADHDPIIAVRDAWAPASFDEVIVSTLPSQSSRWLRIDLPYRIQHMTGALVTHVVEGDDHYTERISVAAPRVASAF